MGMPKRLLLVDDDAKNIFALTAVLKARSFQVRSCPGAREAIALLEAGEEVDALLMDMMMPEMDGYEAIPLIRSLPGRADLYILAVTAQAMLGDRERCLRAGADEYISKPIDIDRLLTLLNGAP